MIPRAMRVTTEQFRTLGKPTRVFRATACAVRYFPAPTYQAAVVIAKKVARTAVFRNRVRRIVYTAFQRLVHTEAIPRGIYVVQIQQVELPKTSNEWETLIRTLCQSSHGA